MNNSSRFLLQPLSAAILVLFCCGVACEHPPEVQRFAARGVVEAVKKDGTAVRITHEDIPGFMQAMTMEFAVKSKELLTDIQPEDAVNFTLEKTTESLYITALQRVDDDPETAQPQNAANDKAVADVKWEVVQEEFTPYPAADFTLTDQDGQAFTLSSQRGKVALLDFIFTRCPGPCPLLSLKFAQLQKQLGDRFGKDIVLLSVTIDPRHDTPVVLKEYARRYSANLAGWKFLTGDTKDIILTTSAYGAAYQANEDGIVDHRLLTCVINREGVVVKEFTGTNHTVENLLTEVNRLLS